MSQWDLLGSLNRIETPFVKVKIGEYVFGVLERSDVGTGIDSFGKYIDQKVKFPNFIQGLVVQKINGTVNKYTLNITYPITQGNDPNFFEKIFSSVSTSREIEFTYGDMSAPTYIYRDEKAIITNISSSFSATASQISYQISAVSACLLATSGLYAFPAPSYEVKPSDVMFEILYDSKYGLIDVFPGMFNESLVRQNNLIFTEDEAVMLEYKYCSVFDYLKYLCDCMTRNGSTNKQSSVFVMEVVDDVKGDLGGAYFKICEVTKDMAEELDTYTIDFGFPSQNIVTAFNIENNETYSIFYQYHKDINDAEYVQRIDDNGNLVDTYAPVVSSGNEHHETNQSDASWWTKVTEYPVKATITLKGLLRPATLMTKVRLNVYYYGRKHISSGLYIVTKEEDRIDFSGYRTTLSLVRVGGDNSI